MKSTETFKKTISDHLEQLATKDSLFAETMKKENKNIDDCVTYILNQVKASGCVGFADDEIYNMAVHYYDEDDLKPGNKITNANVVINQTVELTEADLAKVKDEAMAKAIDEAKQKILKKKSTKKDPSPSDQPTLF